MSLKSCNNILVYEVYIHLHIYIVISISAVLIGTSLTIDIIYIVFFGLNCSPLEQLTNTSSTENLFCFAGHLWGNPNGTVMRTLMFLCCWPEHWLNNRIVYRTYCCSSHTIERHRKQNIVLIILTFLDLVTRSCIKEITYIWLRSWLCAYIRHQIIFWPSTGILSLVRKLLPPLLPPGNAEEIRLEGRDVWSEK